VRRTVVAVIVTVARRGARVVDARARVGAKATVALLVVATRRGGGGVAAVNVVPCGGGAGRGGAWSE
jgi:hypothetical protein